MRRRPIEPTVIIPPRAGGGDPPPPAPPAPPTEPPAEWYDAPADPPAAGGTLVVRESVYVEHHYIEAPPAEAQAKAKQPGWYSKNPRIRFTAFNLSAGMVGLSLMTTFGGGVDLLARVAADPVPMSTTVVTVVAAAAGWKCCRVFRPIGPIGGAIVAAYWGQGTSPLLADLYADAGKGPGLIAPLAVSAGAALACWFFIDRRPQIRRWPLSARWVARIPLAGVVLSCLLYTSWKAS
ncbi:hypothetical protein [Streptomyces sp. NBC_01276]|uniref:hypothetical protein n=1 Tax=Streptomyces sp. NBC_01276 TaxID=2903808 RepID=UPI00352E3864